MDGMMWMDTLYYQYYNDREADSDSEDGFGGQPIYSFRRAIQSRDWCRLDSYACLVKGFYFEFPCNLVEHLFVHPAIHQLAYSLAAR